MSCIFITGTGTEIGKSFLTCQLLRLDQLHHQVFEACKPVITGWPVESSDVALTDTGLILAAQNLPLSPANIDACTPWRYPLPLTPAMAAIDKPLIFGDLVTYCREKIKSAQQNNHHVLIEGAGGLMSPFTRQYTGLDLISALEAKSILVIGGYLGAISHALTALEALKTRSQQLSAVVLNPGLTGSPVDILDMADCLQAFLGDCPLFILNSPKSVHDLYLYLLKGTVFKQNTPDLRGKNN